MHWILSVGLWIGLSYVALLLCLRRLHAKLRARERELTSEMEISESRRKMLEVSTVEMERWVQERVEELRHSNEKLKVTQREYHALVNTVDGVVWEAEVGKPGYTFVSRQAEAILGYPVEDWVREPRFWQRILHPEDRARMTGGEYRTPERKKDTQIEYRMITADGRIRWMRDHIKVIEEPGAPRKMRGIMVDITELKRAETVKSEFLANMSHEIRTPLNAIIGMASVGDGDQECLTTIKTAADSLLMIVNEILDYSKLEAGKVELEVADFKLSLLCRNVFDVTVSLAKAKGIELETEISKELPPDLRGDPGRLMQVLMNLVSNAIKFTGASGKVVLKVKPAGTRLKFEVSDTGIGISEDARKRLFVPFSQADSSTARKYGGTGLGLSISKRLVSLMGGEIGLESAVGKGSTFWFEIPLETAHAPVAEVSPLAHDVGPEKASPMRILVVDDNLANQKVILRMLEKLGHSAEAVANGEEAVICYERGIYDVILMDCQMPEMDGYEATIRIRGIERRTGKDRIPIVALTAHAMARDRKKCEAAGMDDYLSKPVDLRQLRDTLVRQVRRTAVEVKPAPEPKSESSSSESASSMSGVTNGVATGVIDRARLEELDQLQSPGQPDLILELIDCFLLAGPECLKKIRDSYGREDFETIEKAAHRFKSTCHNVGARKLAALCEKIELDPAGGAKASLELPSFYQEATRALKEIASERGKSTPAA